jgi:hypothetical protein
MLIIEQQCLYFSYNAKEAILNANTAALLMQMQGVAHMAGEKRSRDL